MRKREVFTGALPYVGTMELQRSRNPARKIGKQTAFPYRTGGGNEMVGKDRAL
jgi:hypothetical protein